MARKVMHYWRGMWWKPWRSTGRRLCGVCLPFRCGRREGREEEGEEGAAAAAAARVQAARFRRPRRHWPRPSRLRGLLPHRLRPPSRPPALPPPIFPI